MSPSGFSWTFMFLPGKVCLDMFWHSLHFVHLIDSQTWEPAGSPSAYHFFKNLTSSLNRSLPLDFREPFGMLGLWIRTKESFKKRLGLIKGAKASHKATWLLHEYILAQRFKGHAWFRPAEMRPAGQCELPSFTFPIPGRYCPGLSRSGIAVHEALQIIHWLYLLSVPVFPEMLLVLLVHRPSRSPDLGTPKQL